MTSPRHLPADLVELVAAGLLVEAEPGVFRRPTLEHPARLPSRAELHRTSTTTTTQMENSTVTDAPLDNFEAGRLAANARAYQPDAQLDAAADLFRADRAAWDRLQPLTRDQSFIQLEMRDTYREAVRRGLVPDDRGPAAA